MKKKNKLLRWLIIAVIVLIVFAIIGKKAGWIGGEEKKEVSTEKVALRSIAETVSASGKIPPRPCRWAADVPTRASNGSRRRSCRGTGTEIPGDCDPRRVGRPRLRN